MYQERLRLILEELEDIQCQIMNGITIDPSLLEGIKEENLGYLEISTDTYIGSAYQSIETLIDRLNGDQS